MIETVVSVELPVEEVMKIKKNRLTPDIISSNEKRICIVTGMYGDELGGQYICYEIIRRIKANYDKLKGIVDVYPAINPLGLDSVSRGVPSFDLDVNTVFPGSRDGTMAEYAAAKIVEDIAGADFCVDLHSSNIYLKELPQVRVNEDVANEVIPYAKHLNTDIIWIHPSTSVKQGSLAYALNNIGVKTVVIEADTALRINVQYCEQLVEGIFSLLSEFGVWEGEVNAYKTPIISEDKEVVFINCNASGVFIPKIKHSNAVKKGDVIGEIVAAITGSIEEKIIAPCDGVVFSLREYPVVAEGSLIARILGGSYEE